MKKITLVLSLLILGLLSGLHPALAKAREKVVIFHAGSLSVPLKTMEKAFEAKHPDIDVQLEGSGSRKCARKISDLGKECDIMASADFSVIDNLLIPKFATWNIRFATNQMVLCYNDKSAYAQELTPESWTDILARKGVEWGHSDPNLDPCGYRSLMVLQLAEMAFKKPGLNQRLLANRPLRNIRPKEVELIALLETGALDYAWEYRSIAVQHKLKFQSLPSEINLGSYALNAFYQQAQVQVNGKKPGEKITLRGRSITYGVTLINDAPHKAAAIKFLDYMLDPEGGLKILKDMGQPPIVPARVSSAKVTAILPEVLQKRVVADK